MQSWDYRWNASYFVTICTKDREHFFGHVTNGKMELSSLGAIADVLWYEIKNHTKHVKLGAFVIMPNHIHGVIKIQKPIKFKRKDIAARHALSLILSPGQQRFQNPGKNSLSSIIGSYKSAVTKHANRLRLSFGWQSRFYDHIIRSERDLFRISKYILSNPLNWDKDDLNVK